MRRRRAGDADGLWRAAAPALNTGSSDDKEGMGLMTASRFLSLRGSIIAPLVSLLALVALTLSAGPAAAMPTQFGSSGTGAGQMDETTGVAVEQSSGDVYVVDRNNNRVEQWSGEGTFLEAWGFGVENGEEKLETCTSATGCREGQEGFGAGQFMRAEGVAVDNSLGLSHGDVYVVDTRNNRVEKFGPDGEFILMFGGEVNETKDGQAGASEAEKDLCTQSEIETSGVKCKAGGEGAGNGEFDRLGEFNDFRPRPIAVGSEGQVYVGDDERVQRFSEGGVYESTVLQGAGQIEALAAAPGGEIYVASAGRTGVREYDEAGTEVGSPRDEGGLPITIATGPGGSLFVDDDPYTRTSRANEAHSVRLYAANGVETEVFDEGEGDGESGIAWGEAAGLLYLINQPQVRVLTPPPPGPEVRAGSTSASEVLPTTAGLDATVNPEGHESEYLFEYGTAPCTSGSCGVATAASTLSAAFERDAVEMAVSKLQPETTYHFRVVATDSEGDRTVGPEASFTTPPAVVVEETSAIEVDSSSATLLAELDPLRATARWRIEYGPTSAYGSIAGEGTVSAVATGVPVRAFAQSGLAAASTYHYRVIAEDEREGERYVVDGPDRTFITEPAKTSFELPDNRQWELVSPPNMHGAFMEPIRHDLVQASANGEAFVDVANLPTEQAAANADGAEVLSLRGAEGWVSKDISSPYNYSPGTALGGYGSEYHFFSQDLSRAVVQPLGGRFMPLSPEATESTAYLRSDFSAGDPASVCSQSCYTPLVSAGNVPTGTHFGSEEEREEGGMGQECAESDSCGPHFVGATPTAEQVVLRTHQQLTETPTEGHSELYEWSAGKLQLVSALPQGETNERGGTVGVESYFGAHESNFGGFYDDNGQHAISGDGSRVIFEATTTVSQTSTIHLYLHDSAADETVRLDLPQGGTGTGQGRPRYMTASQDGSRIFFIDEAGLTRESSPGGSDLYEYDIEAPLGSRLKDLTIDHADAANAANVLGASENGSYVYFTAAGALAEGASPGECSGSSGQASSLCNLYVWHEGVTTFIAGLSQGDEPDWESGCCGTTELSHMTGRVSPDGRFLAFMSQRSLTGYDNVDALSGQPDEEVFLYHAGSAGGEAGKLVCASCNPTGARPIGQQYEENQGAPLPYVGASSVWKPDQWLAALVPPWTGYESTLAATYQSRYLSDSGRLFFDSRDPLVPQDVGGNWGVYEYELPGVGSCTEGSPTYSARAAGCQSLISSPTAREESAFLDASESGGDVFFLTAEKLVGGDLNSTAHVYDAHECTASALCFPTPPVSPPPCESGDACKSAPNAQPSVFGAPPSATFSGAGNLTSAPAKPAKKLTRRQKLQKALHACAKKRKHQRARCEGRARRRYGGAARKAAKYYQARKLKRRGR